MGALDHPVGRRGATGGACFTPARKRTPDQHEYQAHDGGDNEKAKESAHEGESGFVSWSG
jgi:hypothetical protein